MNKTDYKKLIRAGIINDLYIQAYMKLLEEFGKDNLEKDFRRKE